MNFLLIKVLIYIYIGARAIRSVEKHVFFDTGILAYFMEILIQ